MGYLYRFEFSSCFNKMKNMNYVVYADNEELMCKFLLQHNFTDSPADAITVLSEDDKDFDDMNMLKEYHFKSYKDGNVYSVISSEFFVSQAIESVCYSLNDTTLFGECIIRRDIEIFKLIGDIISDLKHINILDFALINDDSTGNTTIDSFVDQTNLLKTYRCNNLDLYFENDDSILYLPFESMTMNRYDGCVEPITLESYVSSFADQMIDSFAH